MQEVQNNFLADLLVQSHKLKHQDNVWNLFKANNNETKLRSLTSF